MAFPPRLLNDGEEIVLDVRPHWRYLVGPLATVAVVMAGAVATLVLGAPSAASWAVVGLLALALLWLLGRYVRWATTSLVVTSDRLIHRQGVLSRSGKEIPLDHLNDITYLQTLFDRVVGAGDLVLESAGRDGQEVFADLPNPARIQNEIYRQISRRRAAPAGTSGAPDLSIPEQIDKLDRLRQRGVITQAEFDLKKAELLSRM